MDARRSTSPALAKLRPYSWDSYSSSSSSRLWAWVVEVVVVVEEEEEEEECQGVGENGDQHPTFQIFICHKRRSDV